MIKQNWQKFEYDSHDNLIKHEDSDGSWRKFEYDSNNNLIKEWFSLTEASKELSINIGSISQVLNGKQKST